MSTAPAAETLQLSCGLTAIVYRDPAAAERRRRAHTYPGLRDDEQRRAYDTWVRDKAGSPCQCARCRMSPNGGTSA